MKSDKAAAAIQAGIDKAVEVGIHPDQRPVEAKLLAALATVINADQNVLKYDLLDLMRDDFHFHDHRDIFAAMKALADSGDHVDLITLSAKIQGRWSDALADIFDPAKADPSAARTYKEKIIRWSKVKQAGQLGHAYLAAVEDAAKDDSIDLADLIARLQQTTFDPVATDRINPILKTEADLVDDFQLDLSSKKKGYDPGFDRLKKVIRGLTPGLFVIAAPPSAGKTTYVKQLADQVAEKNSIPVLFFSYEQSAAELRIKSLARLSRIVNEDIKEWNEAKLTDRFADAVQQYKRFGKWITVIEADREYTVGRIRLIAQRAKMLSNKAPVIVVDYLQIVPVSDPALKDKRAEVDFLVSDFRRMARDIGSPIILVSSMSRAEYKDAKMSGFKESGGIEYGSDIAAIMKVEDEMNEGTSRTVSLNIIKNRNGRRAKIGMTYDMEHDSFNETSDEFLKYLESLGVNINDKD